MSEERPIQNAEQVQDQPTQDNEQQNSRNQNTEQKRAKRAWENVQKIAEKNDEAVAKKYNTQARRIASLIQVNGLGQTLAFLRSKKDRDEGMEAIYEHISCRVMGWIGEDENDDLLESIFDWSVDKYRRATTEALAFALWLRRFAEAKWGSADEDGTL